MEARLDYKGFWIVQEFFVRDYRVRLRVFTVYQNNTNKQKEILVVNV